MLFPSTRDYSFFSPVHQTYTRLDYLFIQQRDFELVQSARIHPITLSDHAPVSLSLRWGLGPTPRGIWRLNETLLREDFILEELQREMQHFFEENQTDGISPLLVWETHKAVIRGLLVKHGARKKQQHTQQVMELVRQIEILEIRHKNRGAREDGIQLQLLRDRLRALNLKKARFLLTRSRRSFYEFGNRSSKGLARALKIQHGRSCISQICRPDGSKAVMTEEIVELFRGFYETLYNIKARGSPAEVEETRVSIQDYLVQSGMPKLSVEARQVRGPTVSPGVFGCSG